jgi:hypothetical protein
MNAQVGRMEGTADAQRRLAKRQLDAVGWGLLLLITGGALLLPDQHVAEVAWLIGVGLVLLGANVVRYLKGMRLGTGNFVLGIAALAAGVAALFGISLPLIPILLILLGAGLLIGLAFERDR